MRDDAPEIQLESFIDCYEPEVAGVARSALAKLRALLPGAMELVYDNYNALVIGFSATEHASHAIVSIALYPRWVNLFFLQGAILPDPHGLLQGSGKQVRSVRLVDGTELDRPEVLDLISAAVDFGSAPFETASHGKLIIKSISRTQRPRRPARL